jgi:hypothetical protein
MHFQFILGLDGGMIYHTAFLVCSLPCRVPIKITLTICMHETAQELLKRFSLNVTLESLVKLGQN